ncbi:MAG: penicillin-binding protein [Acidobacteriia bacterium]|nr:penicillin-binding protein [Terriglobia bacterium]
MNLGPQRVTGSLALVMGLLLCGQTAAAATSATAKRHKHIRHRVVAAAVTAAVAHSTTQAAVIHTKTSASLRTASLRRRRVFYNPWTEPTFADSTLGDKIAGEEPVVRKAALDALGPYNGTVVVADPQTGRILSIVNQKLALKGAYQPCSTVKIMVSLASLSEGIIDPSKSLRVTRRFSIDMTRALALSNNLYFAKLGQQLGFERVQKYGKLFGLGEKAGLDIPGEEPGFLASEPPETGVGMMTSFGDGIRLTPLELMSIVSTVANNGTMYYLQYPRSEEEVQKFVPQVKRTLDIASLVPQIRPGMMGAVEYGTARRANFEAAEPILGKTGTCTDTAQPGVHLGWFGSFRDDGARKVAVVVLLTGGRGVAGPVAAQIAGNVYRNLEQDHYFAPAPTAPVVPAMFSMQSLFTPPAQN